MAAPADEAGRTVPQDLIRLDPQAKFFSTSVHPQRTSGERSTGGWYARELRLPFDPLSSARPQASPVQRKAMRNSTGSGIIVDRRVTRPPVRAFCAFIA